MIKNGVNGRRFFVGRREIFCSSALVVLIAGLFFSFSRSAWLAFWLGLIIYFGYSFRKKYLFNYIFILIAAAGVLVAVYPGLVAARLSSESRLEAISASQRISGIEQSFDLIKEHWLIGVGTGNYTKALAEQLPGKPYYFSQPVHNLFLLIWAELGVVGLGLFIVLILAVLRPGAIAPEVGWGLSLPLLATLIILGLFDHYLWSLYFGQLLMWFVLGIVYRGKNFVKS